MKHMMRKGKVLLICLGLVIVLAGCAEVKSEANKESNQSDVITAEKEETAVSIPKELVLYPETVLTNKNDELFSSFEKYVFSGFTSDDRLAFEKEVNGGSALGYMTVYHPAKLGYTFKLKGFTENSFEIIEVNLEENYVKLKVMTEGGEQE